MRKIYWVIITIAFSSISCEDETKELVKIEGTYEGTFIRSAPNVRYEPSQVTITFSDGQFQGQSQMAKYPAICKGTYKLNGGNIEFVDSCAWTADFDWSLILNGAFTIEATNDELRLRRTNGKISDYYELKIK